MPERSKGQFLYETALSRNLGWITEWEQQALRAKRVGIAGLGGVGGSHLLALTRLGIGSFHIADLDTFGFENFNRQAGATLASVGVPKVDVLASMARAINPELAITTFGEGIIPQTIDPFLSGVDLFVDGLDFFALDVRRLVFARCRELGIPAVTAAPLGMGTAFLIFHPRGMSFEEYFGFEGLPLERQYVQFLVGLAPKALHFPYLVDKSYVDLPGKRGPSNVAAVELCAGVAATEALKLLLGRGSVRAAPYFHQFDAYRGKWVTKKLRLGNGHPLQRLKLTIANRAFAAMSRQAVAAPPAPPTTDLERIIDAARWAPSGDNTQPWRVQTLPPDHLIVRVRHQAADDLYDYRDGEPSVLSAGMFLESIRIGASALGRGAQWRYEGGTAHEHRIAVHLPKQGVQADPLLSCLFLRSVDRRPYALTPLSDEQKRRLSASLGDILELHWYESLRSRWRMARLSALATHIRLQIPEAFRVHQRVIDWEHAYSQTGMPAAAIGLDPVTLKLMRWAIQDWGRMQRLNKLPASTLPAVVQLDYLPGLCCAGFFSLKLKAPRPSDGPARVEMLLTAGAAIQRFWLTVTRLGLALQPNLATLIFAHFGRDAIPFTEDEGMRVKAQALHRATEKAMGKDAADLVFVGRVGRPSAKPLKARSVRRSFADLMTTQTNAR